MHCVDTLRILCYYNFDKRRAIMANLNIRVDDTLKQQAELIFSNIGITLSATTTIFLKQVVRL